jgi:hypothetical protein
MENKIFKALVFGLLVSSILLFFDSWTEAGRANEKIEMFKSII